MIIHIVILQEADKIQPIGFVYKNVLIHYRQYSICIYGTGGIIGIIISVSGTIDIICISSISDIISIIGPGGIIKSLIRNRIREINELVEDIKELVPHKKLEEVSGQPITVGGIIRDVINSKKRDI